MRREYRFAATVIAVVLLLCALPTTVVATTASAQLPEVEEASAVYFYHLESGQIIGAKNAEAVVPAGSTVKILSGLLFTRRFGAQLMDEIEITAEMLSDAKGYCYGLEMGEVYTVEQLLYLAICGSYNDAFCVLAYVIGFGDVSAFVAEMNRLAKDCGAVATTVTDPTGVADSSFTTAQDLARIALVAAAEPLYMQICGSASYDINEGKRIHNRNALISRATDSRYYDPRCHGMSAGSTNAGGCCVVTLAQRERDSYLCIVLGGAEGEGTNPENYGYAITNRLVDWVFETYDYVEVLTPETEICRIAVRVSDLTDSVAVRAAESVSLHLPKGATLGEEVRLSIRLTYESLEAPVTEGMHVGYAAIVYEGRVLATVKLYAAESAERSGFISRLMQIQSLTESRAARAGLICFAVALSGWLLTEYLIRRYRRHKWDRYFSHKVDVPDTLLKKK